MLSRLPRLPDAWLGSAESYLRVAQIAKYAMEHPERLAALMGPVDADDEEDPRSFEDQFLDSASDQLIEINGRVGMVKVDGPLVNENSFWNMLFGMTSYDTVATALQKVMLERPEVEHAVMVMSTGGGSADGVDNFSNNVRALKAASDVTLLTHVQSAALSAGYWMGSLADVIYGSRMAEVGSIGVVMTHRSVAGALEQMGIKDTVITAGSQKAVGHPSQKLSAKDEKILQKQTDRLYSFFTEHVAAERHLSLSGSKQWADGKIFFMQEAIDIGLADFVLPLQDLLADLNEGFEEEEVVSSGAEHLDNIRRGKPIAA
jgi:signal peptide peptidase SppA